MRPKLLHRGQSPDSGRLKRDKITKVNFSTGQDSKQKFVQHVKQLEMHLDMMNKHYFMHCIDRKSFEETNCVASFATSPQQNDLEHNDLDIDWIWKFYNYE